MCLVSYDNYRARVCDGAQRALVRCSGPVVVDVVNLGESRKQDQGSTNERQSC